MANKSRTRVVEGMHTDRVRLGTQIASAGKHLMTVRWDDGEIETRARNTVDNVKMYEEYDRKHGDAVRRLYTLFEDVEASAPRADYTVFSGKPCSWGRLGDVAPEGRFKE